MIKISKDNIFFWRYFFGGGLITMNILFIVFVFAFNFWLMYLLYLLFGLLPFIFAKLWHYLFIVDAYLSSDLKTITFKNLKDEAMEFRCSEIEKCTTKKGITTVIINHEGNLTIFYFMINSKENLIYLRPAV